MIAYGEAGTAFDQRVEAVIATRADWVARQPRYGLAAAPVASPTHRAVASDCVRVAFREGEPVFLKLRHADMAEDVTPAAGRAARKAAQLGIAPEVVFEADGAIGLAYLPEPWRYARVGDLQDGTILGQVLDAKARLHGDGLLGHRVCPFARIESLAAEARAAGAPLPDGTHRLVATMALVREAIHVAGIDLAFCHNDGIASNVMIGEGEVRLVDFDLAGDNDPWFDVGALLNEACAFEPERREAVERYAGRFDERLYNRCRLYGAVDDVMGGLWGVTRAVTSARSGIEFYKYGTWRLLHARTTIGAREFESWLRRL
ncbi:phosphotransferase family protein [Methylobacterium sp. E-045]|uniref:phosphotransferase family protein n=1 Tax=Methylobacterium sp. E-045 TaxID=2836575 RepID=UPI001FBBD4CC|nr:phosphotransferase [Methylobacterium sp. E-045]MCJ2127915.1 phosphotransferase [Methylobacterium sp. E-045]